MRGMAAGRVGAGLVGAETVAGRAKARSGPHIPANYRDNRTS